MNKQISMKANKITNHYQTRKDIQIFPVSNKQGKRMATFSNMLYLNNRKDVRLPVQLQRAMAAEAEAAREARAKVRETLVSSLLEKL